MYIRIEFIIILAVFFFMFFISFILAWRSGCFRLRKEKEGAYKDREEQQKDAPKESILIKDVTRESVSEENVFLERDAMPREASVSAGELTGIKILIVDDDILNMKIVTSLLEPYGLQITSAYSGRQCLEELSKNQDYEMIFLDHRMPEMDGIETFHRIRAMKGEYFSQVPVIALTAAAFENPEEVFEKEGFQGLVTKPVHMEEMEQVLKKYGGLSIPGMDTDMGLKRWNGNREKYKGILEVVYKEGQYKLQEMRQYLEEKEYGKYLIEVHSAKSVTAGIGAMKVSALAKEQEFAVKEQKLYIVEEKGEAFLRAYEMLLSHIGGWLKSNNRGNQERTSDIKHCITKKELEERFEGISRLIGQYEDEKAVGQLTELLEYNTEPYPVSFINEVIDNLNRLNYTEANSRIKNRRSEFDEKDIINR